VRWRADGMPPALHDGSCADPRSRRLGELIDAEGPPLAAPAVDAALIRRKRGEAP
jgi:hypothetical protein